MAVQLFECINVNNNNNKRKKEIMNETNDGYYVSSSFIKAVHCFMVYIFMSVGK